MHDTGCLGLVHWDDPEVWSGREEGGGFMRGSLVEGVQGSDRQQRPEKVEGASLVDIWEKDKT